MRGNDAPGALHHELHEEGADDEQGLVLGAYAHKGMTGSTASTKASDDGAAAAAGPRHARRPNAAEMAPTARWR